MGERRLVWYELTDPSTENFFYACPYTGQCSWECPPGQIIQDQLPKWWELYDAESDRAYYFDNDTQETHWFLPPNLNGLIPIPLSLDDDRRLRNALEIGYVPHPDDINPQDELLLADEDEQMEYSTLGWGEETQLAEPGSEPPSSGPPASLPPATPMPATPASPASLSAPSDFVDASYREESSGSDVSYASLDSDDDSLSDGISDLKNSAAGLLMENLQNLSEPMGPSLLDDEEVGQSEEVKDQPAVTDSEATLPEIPVPLLPDWTEEFDENYGVNFYFNHRTGESTWIREEVEDPEAAVKVQSATKPAPKSVEVESPSQPEPKSEPATSVSTAPAKVPARQEDSSERQSESPQPTRPTRTPTKTIQPNDPRSRKITINTGRSLPSQPGAGTGPSDSVGRKKGVSKGILALSNSLKMSLPANNPLLTGNMSTAPQHRPGSLKADAPLADVLAPNPVMRRSPLDPEAHFVAPGRGSGVHSPPPSSDTELSSSEANSHPSPYANSEPPPPSKPPASTPTSTPSEDESHFGSPPPTSTTPPPSNPTPTPASSVSPATSSPSPSPSLHVPVSAPVLPQTVPGSNVKDKSGEFKPSQEQLSKMASVSEDIKQFQLAGFAKTFFKQRKKSFFDRKTVPLAKLIQFQATPLSGSLLRKGISSKEAIGIFKRVQIYMGDRGRSPGKPSVARYIVERGIRKLTYRDEIYCQIAKQITNNSRPASLYAGWELMALCLQLFSPNRGLVLWMDWFLHEKSKSPDGKVKTFARYSVRQLAKISEEGGRGVTPTDVQIVDLVKSAFKRPVFGVSLKEIMDYQKETDPGLDLPKVLVLLAEEVERLGGFQTEGIFRLSGNTSEMTSLRLQIEKGNYQFECSDPHVPGSLLKLWLRQLQEPLIPDYHQAITASTDGTASCAIVYALDPLTQKIIKFLIQFIRKLAKPQNIQVTKMTVNNLAMVFAPNLLRCPLDDPAFLLSTQRDQQVFMRHLINSLEV
eukprot:TRINITY_DN2046_c0_g1_i1.p1 TRINITY_DN2046_c0_g1~~TRINITY_DN2046_c0_g1_i1.p1  ORF type:complete len:994 (+),score=247.42 TRINITY_DN2046_c0_g1_i1:36-2984(+)